jgi:hypothetical protein
MWVAPPRGRRRKAADGAGGWPDWVQLWEGVMLPSPAP